MGFVRINIPNPHGVYMHDTPSKGIFGDDFRFVSSGCVRVQNVRDYITWILKDTPGWSREQIDAVFKSGEADRRQGRERAEHLLDLRHGLGDPDGLVQFRDDIYNRDGFGSAIPRGEPRPVEPDEDMFLNWFLRNATERAAMAPFAFLPSSDMVGDARARSNLCAPSRRMVSRRTPRRGGRSISRRDRTRRPNTWGEMGQGYP